MTFCPGRRGRRAITPGSAGSRPEGEGGKGLGAEVDGEDLQDGQGQRDEAAGKGEQQERDDLGHGVGEDVEHELAHVVVNPATFLHARHDRGEVVVGEHHGGGLACDLGAAPAHGHTDVGVPQRGRVVDPVAGHRDDLAVVVQGVGDPQLGLGRGPGEHDLLAAREQLLEVLVGQRVQREPVDHPVGADAHLAGDLARRAPVVPGDDVDADARGVAGGHRGADLRSGRVHQPDQAEQLQARSLDGVAVGGLRAVPVPRGDGDHAQRVRGHLLDRRVELGATARGQRAARQDLLRRALGVRAQSGADPVEGGHAPPSGSNA